MLVASYPMGYDLYSKMNEETAYNLESQIAQWRSFISDRKAIAATDVEELESHLRDQVEGLVEQGLEEDEAFLVAVKRMGNLDAISNEFAREHSERLWKQLVTSPDDKKESEEQSRIELMVVLGLAFLAALLFKTPENFGAELDDAYVGFYMRNISFFVLPLLAGFWVWKRGSGWANLKWMIPVFGGAMVFANIYPFAQQAHTEQLLAIHLPLVLWTAVGVAYAAGEWRTVGRRMDFIRFSGELFIYYVLIALGGGVLTAFTVGIFEFIGVDLEVFISQWLIPCGALGAIIVASWLVEAKKSVVENMAPVLTRIFTPMFALLLLAFLVTMLVTGSGIDVSREVLIGFDLLLVLVLGLLLYAISARDPESPPGVFDVMQFVLVVSALVVDIVALTAISGRIFEYGFSPNKVAALGMNIILLVNLAWSAVLYFRFMRRRIPFTALERWQTNYLPVYTIWAAIVVIVFPPLFGYV